MPEMQAQATTPMHSDVKGRNEIQQELEHLHDRINLLHNSLDEAVAASYRLHSAIAPVLDHDATHPLDAPAEGILPSVPSAVEKQRHAASPLGNMIHSAADEVQRAIYGAQRLSDSLGRIAAGVHL